MSEAVRAHPPEVILYLPSAMASLVMEAGWRWVSVCEIAAARDKAIRNPRRWFIGYEPKHHREAEGSWRRYLLECLEPPQEVSDPSLADVSLAQLDVAEDMLDLCGRRSASLGRNNALGPWGSEFCDYTSTP